jgi:hypothetical protein
MKLRAFRVFVILLLFVSVVSAQGPEVAPGLTITNDKLPWVLDRFDGKQELVPIHHSTVGVNNHKGSNFAGSLAGSVFYKPKLTIEADGLHARVAVHDVKASFYVQHSDDSDDGGGKNSGTFIWVIARATLTKDSRIFLKIEFTQLTGNAKRSDGVIQTVTESLPNGWLKITPVTPLEPGEYAMLPVLKVQNTFAARVYDFSFDPSGPNAKDAVTAK